MKNLSQPHQRPGWVHSWGRSGSVLKLLNNIYRVIPQVSVDKSSKYRSEKTPWLSCLEKSGLLDQKVIVKS